MFSSIRKTITIIFALVSFSIIFNTSPVLADTTSPDQADSNTADDQVTYNISGFEMPYTTLVSKSGERQRHYWLPSTFPKELTMDQVKDSNYMQNLAESTSDSDSLSKALISSMYYPTSGFLGNSITTSSHATLADVLYQIAEKQGDVGLPNAAAYSEKRVRDTVAQTYLVRDVALYLPKGMTADALTTDQFEKFQQDYKNYIRPFEDTQTSQMMDQVFSNKDQLVQYLPAVTSPQALLTLGMSGIRNLEDIDPEATRTLISNALKQPFTDYLVKKGDGYYVTGNIVFVQQAPYIYSLTPKPTPTPAPATSQPVTIHYVDSTGKTLKPDKTLTGSLGSHYTATPLAITGYTLSQTTGEETGTFDTTAKTITYTYTKDPLADVGGLAPKNTVIYATKKIGLYRQATFTKQARKQWYAKKSRINRPMFVVTGYAKSKNGVKRYHVKDVNHSSKTNGQTGYVTANAKYVAHVYYATKHQRVTVINPQGVNAYSQKDLTGQAAHYQQGQVLKVKRIVRHNLTTRFVLSNGRYITANKSLVQAGKVTMPSRVRAKGALNRYTDVQLTRKNRHYSKKASATFTVKGWAYTNANNFGKRDTLRYRVAGGYITGNRHLVTVVK